MSTVLITGGSRGIGLELARQLHGRGDRVIVTCRRPTSELESLGVQVIADLDVTDDEAVRALPDRLANVDLDVLINNAGVIGVESIDAMDLDGIRRQLETNTLGPIRVTLALLPRLKSGSKVGIVTSLMGSMTDNSSGGYYGYRISKAGVNMAGVSLAHDLRGRGVAVLLLHPGMVATDMTGGRGVTASQSAEGLIRRLDELTLDESGTFRHADGARLPW